MLRLYGFDVQVLDFVLNGLLFVEKQLHLILLEVLFQKHRRDLREVVVQLFEDGLVVHVWFIISL